MTDILLEFREETRAELQEIKKQLVVLTNIVTKLETQCSRMNAHISFVEGTYSSLRTPLNFFKTKVEQLIGYNSVVLPILEEYKVEDDREDHR